MHPTLAPSSPKGSSGDASFVLRNDPPDCNILRFSPGSLRHYGRNLGLSSDRAALVALATAILSSPGWPAAAEVTLVVRTKPAPVLGILSAAGALNADWLSLCARNFETAVGRLRYIGYCEAEAAVAELADRLQSLLGTQEARRLPYVAVPRGGLIVLGMLAAMLDLPREQVATGAGTGAPLVVVDDCALSGARFAALIEDRAEPQVIFAHLFSHPDLRAAVTASEPRVLACIAARDLQDEGPGRLAEAYAAARARWEQRLRGRRYWIGDCEHICFPWNEPDHLVWNPATQEVESGWKLVPAPYCFKASHSGTVPEPRIQIQPAGRGPLRPAAEVLFARWRDETLVARIDSGEVSRLPGSAGAMWWALLETGEIAEAHRRLVCQYRIDAEALRSDLSDFCAVLLERGFLEHAATP